MNLKSQQQETQIQSRNWDFFLMKKKKKQWKEKLNESNRNQQVNQ